MHAHPRTGPWLLATLAVGLLSLLPADRAAGDQRRAPDRETVAVAVDAGRLPFVYTKWETFPAPFGPPGKCVRAIRVAGDRVWIGTDEGLAVFENGQWKAWTLEDGLPWSRIRAIDVDPATQDVWLATWGGGLIRFSGGRFDQYTQFNSGLAGDLVFDVAVHDGRVWAATNGGISTWDPRRDEWDLHFERRADGPQTAFTKLCRLEGVLHAGTWRGDVYREGRSADPWKLVDRARAPAAGSTVSISSVAPGVWALGAAGSEVWRVTPDALLRSRRGKATDRLRLPSGNAPRPPINCLAVRADGSVWIGSERGLQVLADPATATWIAYRRGGNGSGRALVLRGTETLADRPCTGALPDGRVHCVAFQGQDVWVGTGRGVARGIGPDRLGARDLAASSDDTLRSQRLDVTVHGQTPASESKLGASPRTIKIAMLAPLNKMISLPGKPSPEADSAAWPDRSAIASAIDDANRHGQYRNHRPFRMVSGHSGFERYGWGMPEDDFICFLTKRHASAIVASLPPGSAMASAVAFCTEIPVVNVSTAPPGPGQRDNPWVFRFSDEDRQRHERLLDHVFDRLGKSRPAVLRTPGDHARSHLDAWVRRARDRDRPVIVDTPLFVGVDDLGPLPDLLRRNRIDVILTWCDAQTSADLVRRMRRAGLTQVFVGSDELVGGEFVPLAGPDPGAVMAAFPCPHLAKADEQRVLGRPSRLSTDSSERLGRPSAKAIRSYGATRQLLKVINIAGTDRHEIRKTLALIEHSDFARLEEGRWKLQSDGPPPDVEASEMPSRQDRPARDK